MLAAAAVILFDVLVAVETAGGGDFENPCYLSFGKAASAGDVKSQAKLGECYALSAAYVLLARRHFVTSWWGCFHVFPLLLLLRGCHRAIQRADDVHRCGGGTPRACSSR